MKINYDRGTGFLVTLRGGGYARGLVARFDGEGIVFGYFFGPALSTEANASLDGLKPDDAVLVGKFGDLRLVNGKWPILGPVRDWSAERWPMPPLVRVDDESGRTTLSFYDEETFRCIREEQVEPSAVDEFPYDRMMGAGAVEIRLTKMLDSGGNSGSV